MKAGPKGPWGAHCNCKTVQLSVLPIYIYSHTVYKESVGICMCLGNTQERVKLASTIPCGKRVSRVVARGVGSHSTCV